MCTLYTNKNNKSAIIYTPFIKYANVNIDVDVLLELKYSRKVKSIILYKRMKCENSVQRRKQRHRQLNFLSLFFINFCFKARKHIELEPCVYRLTRVYALN